MWFFSIWNFFSKVIQKSDRFSVLAQVCTDSMLSKSEILMSLNSKQMSLCQLATIELFPKETKNWETAWKWQKRVWAWWLRLVIPSLCNHAELYSLAWWSLTAQSKDPFQDSKELKMNWTVAMSLEKLSKVTNLGKQIVMNS